MEVKVQSFAHSEQSFSAVKCFHFLSVVKHCVCYVHTQVHACGYEWHHCVSCVHTQVHACGYEWHAESKQLISIIKQGQVPEALSVCLHQLSAVDSVLTPISG